MESGRLVSVAQVGPVSQVSGAGAHWWNPATWFARRPALPPPPSGASPYATSYPVGYDSGPVVLSITEALQVSHLWRAGNIIADSLADVPLEAFTVGSWTDDPLSSHSHATYTGTPPVLSKPEVDYPRTATINKMIWSLLIYGNAYLLTDVNTPIDHPDQVSQVWPLDPTRVTVLRNEQGYRYYRLLAGNERFVDYPESRVIHMPWVMYPGAEVGVGVLAAFGESGLRMAAALNTYIQNNLQESGVPSIVVTIDKMNVDQAEATEIKQQWLASLAGRRQPVVVPKIASVDHIPIDGKLTENYADLYNAVGLEISNITGIPAYLLNASIPGQSLNYSNVQSRQLEKIEGVTPWARRLEEGFSRCLPRTQRALFDMNLLARGETNTRYQSHKTALEAGWQTINEVRAKENLPPLDGGDVLPPPQRSPGPDPDPTADPTAPPGDEDE